MTTGAELLAAARTFEGEPYNQTNPGRCDPNSGFKDCSGDVVAAHAKTGHYGVPTVSSSQAAWCYENGREIDLDTAFHTPGALLFMGADRGLQGFGNDGHVGISGGDGFHVTEARGTAYGVLWDQGTGRSWSGAGLSPVIDYGHGPTPTPAHPVLGRVLRLTMPRERGDDVVDVQTKLWGWAYIIGLKNRNQGRAINPGPEDGIFGGRTDIAVRAFQGAAHLAVDGIVGPATWASLYRI